MLTQGRFVLVALSLALLLQSAEGRAAGSAKDRQGPASARAAAPIKPAHREKKNRSTAHRERPALPESSNRARSSSPSAAARTKGPTPRAAPPAAPPVSVGHPNEGRLEGGARLSGDLPYIRTVSVCPGVDAQWGLPVLVQMIERAAKSVARRYPGSVLHVGDISRRRGGALEGHHSHESGRDADIGFYAVDARGKPISTRSFIRFDASLSSPDVHGARFDLARNWLLVQHLLTDPRARVSHIFIAEPLRQSMLAYARTRGVSRALWNRAAIAMMQPTGSLAHDDHIHVRISCPRSMRGECIELAKNAPLGRERLARSRRRSRSPALRTSSASRSARASGTMSADGAARSDRDRRGARSRLAPLARGATRTVADSTRPRTDHAVDRATVSASASAPGISQEEAEADAVEVKDTLDESGATKITD